jgi:acetyltransferase-like isoleucine patch superfamily enzyme
MGRALANKVDQHLLQLSVLAAAASTTITGGNGGTSVTDADCKTNAASMITSIFECAQALDENDVPSQDRWCVVTPDVYYQLVANDKILNRDFGGNNGVYSDGTVIKVAGINIVKSNTAVTAFTDQSTAISGTNNTYNVDAQYVGAVVFHKSAIGTVKLMDLAMESEYDIRRQGTLMVAKMALGHGILRPESACKIVSQ